MKTKFKLRKFFNLIIIFFAILLSISLLKSIFHLVGSEDRIKEEKEKLTKLEEENRKLAQEVKFVSSEEYVEKQAREKLGLAKEDEIIVILPEKEVLKSLVQKINEEKEELPDPNWKKWLKLFL